MMVGLHILICSGKSRLGLCQATVAGCLTTSSGSDDHKTVPDNSSIVKLEDLFNESWDCLNEHLLANLLD